MGRCSQTVPLSDCFLDITAAAGVASLRLGHSVFLLWSTCALAQQQTPKSGGAESKATLAQAGDIEAGRPPAAAVTLGGEPVVWIFAGIGNYTPQDRADCVSERLQSIVRDRSIQDLSVTVVEVEALLSCVSGSVW